MARASQTTIILNLMSNNLLKLTTQQAKELIHNLIDTNEQIQLQGKTPIAIAVEGESGIGKTSMILQIADERNYRVKKINLAQLEELGDLIGYPIKEYKIILHDKENSLKISEKWVPENTIGLYLKSGWRLTDRHRMSYAIPEWLEDMDDQGTMLIFDDFTRADQRFMNACMEILDRQEYISWKLPQKVTIILTTNPDNGQYQVSSLDSAQQTRFAKFELIYDINSWVTWAYENKIDERCINFMIHNPEIVNPKINPRALSNFFNVISTIEDFDKNIGYITMVGEMLISPEISALFSTFISRRLDKIITINELMDKSIDWNDIRPKLLSQVKKGTTIPPEEYRPDIASIISKKVLLRLINTKNITKDDALRIALIIQSDAFSEDINYQLGREAIKKDKTKFGTLLMKDERFRNLIANI